MQKAVLDLYPNTPVEYTFFDRNPDTKFNNSAFFDMLLSELRKMADLRLSEDEADWLARTCPFLTPQYIEYLKNYRFDPNEVHIRIQDGRLVLGIQGLWHSTILWEVPLMALISECYFKTVDTDWEQPGWHLEYDDRMMTKARAMEQLTWAEFGTRRRRHLEAQAIAVAAGTRSQGFVGTSNVMLARQTHTKPKGTMAHEWFQGISALEGLRHANRFALDAWTQVYKGDLGIALTDTYGSEAFWADFTLQHAKLFDGVRHDSGCPFRFMTRAIREYEKRGIDPKSKTILFSDGLNVDKALDIEAKAAGRIKVAFGIGTHLTNDFEDSPALNMVIKLTKCNGIPVVKLSDDQGKEIGDSDAIKVAKWTHYRQPLQEERWKASFDSRNDPDGPDCCGTWPSLERAKKECEVYSKDLLWMPDTHSAGDWIGWVEHEDGEPSYDGAYCLIERV